MTDTENTTTGPKDIANEPTKTHYSYRVDFGTKDGSLIPVRVREEFEEMIKGFVRTYDMRSWHFGVPLTNAEVVEFYTLADEEEEELCDEEGAVKLTMFSVMN